MVLMDYMTAKEATKKWVITLHRVQERRTKYQSLCGGQAFRAVWEKKGACGYRWIK